MWPIAQQRFAVLYPFTTSAGQYPFTTDTTLGLCASTPALRFFRLLGVLALLQLNLRTSKRVLRPS